MEPITLREKLHTLIDNSTEDKLLEVFHLLEDEEYSDDFKASLDNEFETYKKDGESISREEINTMVEQLLHGKNN